MANYQGLYVDTLPQILGYDETENALLDYAKSQAFTTLSLYGLHKVLHKGDITAGTTDALANFIRKARTTYGIQHVAGIGENADFFTHVISAYNHVRTAANERMDVYNMEFEFWNPDQINNPHAGEEDYCQDYLSPAGLSCDVNGAYTFFKGQFAALHALAKKDNCVCETYVGHPTAAQAAGMLPYADRILVHAYVKDPATAYNYVVERLRYYAAAGHAKIIIIFSSEKEFSGDWLLMHNQSQAFDIFMKSYKALADAWKNNITILGYQWFDYGNMLG